MSEQLCRAQLLEGVKPQQFCLVPNVGPEGFGITTDLTGMYKIDLTALSAVQPVISRLLFLPWGLIT